VLCQDLLLVSTQGPRLLVLNLVLIFECRSTGWPEYFETICFAYFFLTNKSFFTFDSSFKDSTYAICDSKTRIKNGDQDTTKQSFKNPTHFQRKSKNVRNTVCAVLPSLLLMNVATKLLSRHRI
jgi:transcription initiation factor IIF auxiliary subunit